MEPIVVKENAGAVDLLTAAGRYVVIIVGAVPVLMSFLGARNFQGLLEYFHSTDGAAFASAVSAVAAMLYGLYKAHKRGSQLASVAGDIRVPEAVASLKSSSVA